MSTTREYIALDRGDGRASGRARSRHVHVARDLRRRRGWRPARRSARSSTCWTSGSRRARARAGAAARPSRRAQPGDGLLLLQQHRRRRRARARARPRRASPSSTTTSITATARSGASTTIRRCCSSRRISIPYYPGTGAAGEIGNGRGRRLHGEPAARGGRDRRRLRAASTRAWRCRCCEQFEPELILVSAGFDAHMDDPLGGMRADERRTSAADARRSPAVADECCEGRIVAVTEGGYDLAGLGRRACARRSRVLDGETPSDVARLTGRRRAATRRSRQSRRICAKYWTL